MGSFNSTGYLWLLAAIALPIALFGCREPRTTRLELTTFDEDGYVQAHFTEFDQAHFRRRRTGTLEFAFQTERPSTADPTQTITQIVVIREFWNPRPGTTFAEKTQINAQVQYAILTPPTGVRYDGSGFISYRRKRLTGEVIGKIESGNLSPRFRMGRAVEPFGPCRIEGEFRATEDPAFVVRMVERIEGQFSTPIENDPP